MGQFILEGIDDEEDGIVFLIKFIFFLFDLSLLRMLS